MPHTGSLRRWPAFFVLAPLAASLAAAAVRPARVSTAPLGVGAAVGSLSFRDVTGKMYAPGDLRGQPALLFLFLSTQCPVSSGYVSRLQALQQEYAGRGVLIFGVNSNYEES